MHEIDRIDSLVNQLLRFARPAKPAPADARPRSAGENAPTRRTSALSKGDQINRTLQASLDTIRADADQIEQVFLNFFLNAMDAMKRGGELGRDRNPDR